jgi:hypothetical protein
MTLIFFSSNELIINQRPDPTIFSGNELIINKKPDPNIFSGNELIINQRPDPIILRFSRIFLKFSETAIKLYGRINFRNFSKNLPLLLMLETSTVSYIKTFQNNWYHSLLQFILIL